MGIRDIILTLFPFLKVSNYVIGFTDVDLELIITASTCNRRSKLTNSDDKCLINEEFIIKEYQDNIDDPLLTAGCVEFVNINMNNNYGFDNPVATLTAIYSFTFNGWDMNANKLFTFAPAFAPPTDPLNQFFSPTAVQTIPKIKFYNDDVSVIDTFLGDVQIATVGALAVNGLDFDFDITGQTQYDDILYSGLTEFRATVVYKYTGLPVDPDFDLLSLL